METLQIAAWWLQRLTWTSNFVWHEDRKMMSIPTSVWREPLNEFFASAIVDLMAVLCFLMDLNPYNKHINFLRSCHIIWHLLQFFIEGMFKVIVLLGDVPPFLHNDSLPSSECMHANKALLIPSQTSALIRPVLRIFHWLPSDL